MSREKKKDINKRYFYNVYVIYETQIEHLLVGVRGIPCDGVFAEVGATGIPSPSRKDSCLGFCACTTPHQSQNHAIYYVYIILRCTSRDIKYLTYIHSTQRELYQLYLSITTTNNAKAFLVEESRC